jgi:acetyl-CoA acetyltransferase
VREAVIVDAVRTPSGKGKPGGQLAGVHPVRLLSLTLRALVERSGIDPGRVDDVLAGCVSQVGVQAMNIGRSARLGAGFPESVPATTIDHQCGSSQQAAHFAAQGVMAGVYEVVIACGVGSKSRVQHGRPMHTRCGSPGSRSGCGLDGTPTGRHTELVHDGRDVVVDADSTERPGRSAGGADRPHGAAEWDQLPPRGETRPVS